MALRRKPLVDLLLGMSGRGRLQVAARPWREDLVLAAMQAIEAAVEARDGSPHR
jgi:hypothetical protein